MLLRLLAIGALIVAAALPVKVRTVEEVSTWGVDMVLLLDVSTSMQARDVKPDRIGAARAILHDFVLGRTHDRMGLVAFAGFPLLRCPLVADRELLARLIDSTDNRGFQDGTAIGDALLSAANRLRDTRSHSRVVVLLTDGASNAGSVDPVTAARALAAKGIRVYTIGVGKEGDFTGSFTLPDGRTVQGTLQSDLDEKSLSEIARITGGRFWRALDRDALKKAYEAIDALEKSKVESKRYYHREPRHAPWIWAALGLLALSILLERTWLRRLP
jgi:Ca-activated chloride channel family protein